MVFDLDPGAPADVIDCARLALQLQGPVRAARPRELVKTSGSKGLQVYVPLNVADVDFAATKTFSKAVAELFEQSEPERVVARQTKTRREGKVLIDWSQNDRNKTTVCVYSLRARPRPTVSTPLEWDEVRRRAETGRPGEADVRDGADARPGPERGDLFAPLLSLSSGCPRSPRDFGRADRHSARGSDAPRYSNSARASRASRRAGRRTPCPGSPPGASPGTR